MSNGYQYMETAGGVCVLYDPEGVAVGQFTNRELAEGTAGLLADLGKPVHVEGKGFEAFARRDGVQPILGDLRTRNGVPVVEVIT